MDGLPASFPLTVPGEAGHPSLVGMLTDGSEVAVVAPPHPLMGGELSNPVVQAMALGFIHAGLGTLRFDFRGVGDSNGVASGDAGDADADYRAAIAVASRSTTVVVASGYSFGGATAMRVAATLPHAVRVVAVAPPPALLDVSVFAALGARLTVIAAERDDVAPPDELRRLTSAAGGTLHVLNGEGHFFAGALARIVELSRLAARPGGGLLS
jgi:alpha/beta superfamily hydrolase